jgi:hypothetical protein
VIPAVNLNHEPSLRRGEVHDEATDDVLAAEAHAKPRTSELLPEERLRLRGPPAKEASVSGELKFPV